MNNAINWARRFDPNRVKVNLNNRYMSNGKINKVVILYMNNKANAKIILPNNRTKPAEFGSGFTNNKYAGEGYGRLLRAMATKVAQKAKYKKVLHLGHKMNNKRPHSKVANSTYIMRKVLGYRPNKHYKNWSLFEFNKNSMNKVNGVLRKWKTSATLPKPSSKRG